MSVANRKPSTVNRLKVLFLCTGNSCRSQMAEGWARHLKDDEIEAYSAGIEKHGMNTLAVKVMADAGVDISRQYSKLIDELPIKEFDFVITLCAHADETCPFFSGRIIHIGFDDPPKLAAKAKTEEETLVHYRRIRNEIRDFVITLPEGLQGEQGGDAT